MFKYDFLKDKMRKEDLISFIENTDKNIEYTHGFAYRDPLTHNEPISKKEAVKIINEISSIEIEEEENRVHINTYSWNDMF